MKKSSFLSSNSYIISTKTVWIMCISCELSEISVDKIKKHSPSLDDECLYTRTIPRIYMQIRAVVKETVILQKCAYLPITKILDITKSIKTWNFFS